MNNEQNLKELIKQGFAAMKAGSKMAAEVTDNIQHMAKNDELRKAIKADSTQAEEWVRRIDAGLNEAGGTDEIENEIIKAHISVGKKIMETAKDDDSRDLGIIAAGQLALHYWIASFGTQASYAEAVGLDEAASSMKKCVEEAKASDDKYTELAKQILSAN